MPKHTEQLRLRGMNESQIQQAMKAADIVVGFSDYLHKTNYSMDKWMEELRAMMEHIKNRAARCKKRAPQRSTSIHFSDEDKLTGDVRQERGSDPDFQLREHVKLSQA